MSDHINPDASLVLYELHIVGFQCKSGFHGNDMNHLNIYIYIYIYLWMCLCVCDGTVIYIHLYIHCIYT